jgi:hypothetical protein
MRTGAVRNGVTMRTACASGRRRRSGSSSRDMPSCVGQAEPSTCWRTLVAGGQQQGKPSLHLGSIKENASHKHASD